MTSAGYVYVLINSSMEGLVKIGMTRNDPNERARQLSAATGVPTPFVVVFDAYFDDCEGAEAFIHTYLEQKNYRVSNNREFFSVPTNEAVKAVLEAQRVLGSTKAAAESGDNSVVLESEGDSSPDVEDEDIPVWREVYNLANNYHYGSDDTLQDYDEAIELYKKAIKLGSPEACFDISHIYSYEDDYRDYKQALFYLKEGVRRGMPESYSLMSYIYLQNKQIENAKKCWSNLFESQKWKSSFSFRGVYGFRCLFQAEWLGLPMAHNDILLKSKDEIIMHARKRIATDRKMESGDDHSRSAERVMEFASHLFGEDASVSTINQVIMKNDLLMHNHVTNVCGTVTQIINGRCGVVTSDYDEECFFPFSRIIDATAVCDGQRIKFDIERDGMRTSARNVRLLT